MPTPKPHLLAVGITHDSQNANLPPSKQNAEIAKRHAFNSTVLLCMLPLLFALLLSLTINSRSLWYDELYTLSAFIVQPFTEIVSGTYSPNNHILSSLLIKIFTAFASFAGADAYAWSADHTLIISPELSTLPLRFPSMLAGAAACVAFALPLLKSSPHSKTARRDFLLVAAIAAFQPWLLSFSTEARGYALLLFFSILATNALPRFATRFHWPYIFALVAALYTIPIAIILIPAHGLTLLLLHRSALKHWTLSAVLALAAAAALYAPFYGGMRTYATSLAPPTTYPTYLLSLARTLLSGWNCPAVTLSLIALPLLPLGLVAAYKNPTLAPLRPPLLTFSFAALATLLIALIFPSYATPRLALWWIPLSVLATAALLLTLRDTRRILPAFALVVMFSAYHIHTLAVTPQQPLLDSLLLADTTVPPETPIIGVYLGALETLQIYAPALNRPNSIAYSLPDLQHLLTTAPSPPWLLIFHPAQLALADPVLRLYIQSHYTPVSTLPGRIAPTILLKPAPVQSN